MKVDEQTRIWMEKRMGLVPLKTDDGLKAFAKAMDLDSAQVTIVVGRRRKVNEALGISLSGESIDSSDKSAPDVISKDKLQPKVERDLIKMCAEVLKVKESELDIEDDLSEYGVDSIMMMTMLNRIEGMYGDSVEPTAIAEYHTIKGLAGYLIEQGIVKSEVAKKGSRGKSESVRSKWSESGDFQPSIEMPYLKTQRKRFFQSKDMVRSSFEGEVQKIAVIGMACRFPQSNSLELFWDNLRNGRDLIREVPEDRWSIAEYYSPDKGAQNKSYSKWGGYIDDIDLFDAEYFGISDGDALVMDPQHRILLELTQELLDRAGYRREEVSGSKISVFIGGGGSTYIANNRGEIPEEYMKHVLVNTIQNMMAARISDFYNLRGPSQTIDTACSSSLVAIHQACQSLRSGESEMAIAGGIELLLNQVSHIGFSNAEVLSDEGKSYVFDERAKGIVLGEGAGVVLLKPYKAAIEDGDQILGVILGSAVNNDGHTMGLTVPNIEGQKEVIQQAINNSGITADSISYMEAHGTGTLLGDPIEIRAATQVYRGCTEDNQYCAVGSVKSNIGHLLRAAGVASFIKVVLGLQNKEIPATLYCERPHPRFRFEGSPFYPNTEVRKWDPRNGVRRAGISSFGFGGTNCHMVVEEFVEAENREYVRKRNILPLTQFKRKRYWVGKDIVEVVDEVNVLDEEFYRELLLKLSQGDLTIEGAIKLEERAN